MKNDRLKTIDELVEHIIRDAAINNLTLPQAFENACVPYSLLTNRRAKKIIKKLAVELSIISINHLDL